MVAAVLEAAWTEEETVAVTVAEKAATGRDRRNLLKDKDRTFNPPLQVVTPRVCYDLFPLGLCDDAFFLYDCCGG